MFGMQRPGMFGNRQLLDPMTADPRLPRFQQSLMAPADTPQQPMPAPRDPYAPATGTRRIVGILGDFVSGLAGGQANFAQQQNQLAAERRAVERQRQFAEMQASQPEYRTVGNQIVRVDPRTGQAQVAFQGQGEAQTFTDASGNRWERGPDGQNRLVFYETTPRVDNQIGTNDRGERILIQVPRPNGFNPDGTPRTAAPSGPPVGTVRNGYRFNGGNPNDRNSWSPVSAGGPTPPASGNFRP